MKKRTVFICFIILCVCISGIWIYKRSGTKNPLKALPTPEEMREWDTSELYSLKAQIEEIPLDSCEEYFADEIKKFLKGYENVELGAVTIEKDFLSVAWGKNYKSLFNLIFNIDVVVDTDKQENAYILANELPEELAEYLNQYSYFNLKVKEVDIHVLDRNQGKLRELGTSYSIMDEKLFAEQPEDEYAVQTLAFQYSDIEPDFSLRKFGVIPETRELYVEYYIQDDCFRPGRAEETIAGLEKAGGDIREYLLSQEISKEFAAASQAKQLTVCFSNGCMEDDAKFTFEIP